MSRPSLDITFPVLNEEERLERGVTRTLDFCGTAGIAATITIADNGSTDRTAEIGDRLTRTFGQVRYLSVGERGVGRALKASWSRSRADVVGYMDVDLATDLRHLPEMLDLFAGGGAAVVSGSRLLPASKVINRSPVREITSRGFNWIIQRRLGVGFSDGMCGFKFLRRSVFERIRDRHSPLSDGWFFNTEVLVKAEWLGETVRDIPVHWTDDRSSRVRFHQIIPDYLREIERLRRQKHDGMARSA